MFQESVCLEEVYSSDLEAHAAYQKGKECTRLLE